MCIRDRLGIGGGRPLGFGPQRVLSLPDGVAQVLAEFLDRSAEEAPPRLANGRNGHSSPQANLPAPTGIVGDLCPDCGNSSLVNEEGCRKCNSCGYSEC